MISCPEGSIRQESERLLVLGVTGSWAFAAGALLLSLLRHNRRSFDIVLFHDGKLLARDEVLFQELGCQCLPYVSPYSAIPKDLLALYSPLCFAKFSCFALLHHYGHILWLDADCIVQDSIEDIWDYGPFSLANEDEFFYEDALASGAKINAREPLPGLAPDAPNRNAGVFVLDRRIAPFATQYSNDIFAFLQQNAALLRYPDQAALNWLAQRIEREMPELWRELPTKFNCHPKNPAALYAPIVHAFGAYKLWNDGLTQACFPEWQRDYARWRKRGGSAWQGQVENSQYLGQNPFALLGGFFTTLAKSEAAMQSLGERLKREEAARKRLEAVVSRLG